MKGRSKAVMAVLGIVCLVLKGIEGLTSSGTTTTKIPVTRRSPCRNISIEGDEWLRLGALFYVAKSCRNVNWWLGRAT